MEPAWNISGALVRGRNKSGWMHCPNIQGSAVLHQNAVVVVVLIASLFYV